MAPGTIDRCCGAPLDERSSADALDFATIYRTYFERVRRWVRALGGPNADIEDLVQDVFIIVHRRLRDFDGQNVEGWMYQIARHRVRDFRRLRWFRVLLGGRQADDVMPSPGESPEAALNRRESEAVLARMLAKLPEVGRTTFILFEIEGCSGVEIARLHEVPINTVWARLHNARKALAAQIKRPREARTKGAPR